MEIRGRRRDIITSAAGLDLPVTTAGLARSCRVSRLTMHRILTGERVGEHTAEIVARRLGVSVDAIFDIRIEGRDEPCGGR